MLFLKLLLMLEPIGYTAGIFRLLLDQPLDANKLQFYPVAKAQGAVLCHFTWVAQSLPTHYGNNTQIPHDPTWLQGHSYYVHGSGKSVAPSGWAPKTNP